MSHNWSRNLSPISVVQNTITVHNVWANLFFFVFLVFWFFGFLVFWFFGFLNQNLFFFQLFFAEQSTILKVS